MTKYRKALYCSLGLLISSSNLNFCAETQITPKHADQNLKIVDVRVKKDQLWKSLTDDQNCPNPQSSKAIRYGVIIEAENNLYVAVKNGFNDGFSVSIPSLPKSKFIPLTNLRLQGEHLGHLIAIDNENNHYRITYIDNDQPLQSADPRSTEVTIAQNIAAMKVNFLQKYPPKPVSSFFAKYGMYFAFTGITAISLAVLIVFFERIKQSISY